MAFATTWTDLEGVMLGKQSQAAKDKYCMISHMWNLKETTELIDTENRPMVCRDRRWGGAEMGEEGSRGTNSHLQNK